jgi:4-hydroxybenzoate polyprenyltransferase
MLLLRALLVAAVAIGGIAIVLWLVTLIAGETTTSIAIALVVCFAIAAAWAYLHLKHDADNDQRRSHG